MDDESRAELPCYLVVAQFIARERVGIWIRTDHLLRTGPRDVPQRAADYACEALQWLLDDGVVARFDVTPQRGTPNRLELTVIAHRRDGSRVAMTFAQVWTD
jgi:phage gp46-like protein